MSRRPSPPPRGVPGRPTALSRAPARRRRRDHRRGFTMLELLVTLGITVVGLTGLMSLHVATIRGNESTAKNGEAVTIAQETLEMLRADPMVKLFQRFAVTDVPIDASLNTVVGRGGITYRRRVQVVELTAASTDLLRVRVTVAWSDDNASGSGSGTGSDAIYDHQVTLELIRTRGEGL